MEDEEGGRGRGGWEKEDEGEEDGRRRVMERRMGEGG